MKFPKYLMHIQVLGIQVGLKFKIKVLFPSQRVKDPKGKMAHRRPKFMGLLTQCPLYLTAVGNSYIERWGRFSIHPADTFLPEGIIRGIGMGTLSQRDEGEKLLATVK